MSTQTKQSVIDAFIAHMEAEWAEAKATASKLFAEAAAEIPKIASTVDKLAPIAEVGLTVTGNAAAATAVSAAKTIADTASTVVEGGVTAQNAPGLIQTVEKAIGELLHGSKPADGPGPPSPHN